jgi:4-diphosphocytidyl-2-C-methyl-D-erythritol kinase
MNELACNFKKNLPSKKMLDLAARLGSDVPFFVEITLQNQEKSSVRSVSGRGEIFRFLPPLPPLGILLAFPGFSSHTGKAFALLDEKRPFIPKKTHIPLKTEELWASPANWDFFNDFQELFLNYGSETEKNAYKTIFSDLKKSGAAFTGLSGSGSACFGIFSGPAEAEQAKNKLNGAFYVLQSTFFLAL